MNPLVLKSAGNPPLNVSVKLPVTMEKDKITLANAELTTPQSQGGHLGYDGPPGRRRAAPRTSMRRWRWKR